MTRAELVALMNELEAKGGPDEIAAFLRAAGVRGHRRGFHCCPVANLIKSRGGGPRTAVSGGLASFDTKAGWVTVPKQVQEFVSAFDDGTYTDLEEQPEPATAAG